jgi:hypothetical protein
METERERERERGKKFCINKLFLAIFYPFSLGKSVNIRFANIG